MKKLKVNEIFYSLQGEGANTGLPVIFIRLSGCNKNCSFCDTDHNEGVEMDMNEIHSKLLDFSSCNKIIFTGGEPLLQLEKEHIQYLERAEYVVGLETNGTLPLYKGEVNLDFNYVSCSPKVSADVICQNFLNHEVNEFRYPLAKGQEPPDYKDLPMADNYFVSPICDGGTIIKENLDWCIAFCLSHPRWQLSVQNHKLWKIK